MDPGDARGELDRAVPGTPRRKGCALVRQGSQLRMPLPQATILRPVPERYAIAQVTPHAWEDEHEVNAFVGELADELAARGHRMLVLAPSRSRELVRESRRLIRAARENPEALFDPDGGVRVLGVGELLPLQRRGGLPAPPVDVARTIEEVLSLAPLDFVHVHEPFAPSASSVALRHSPRAQRRLVPRADRARAVDPGRPPLRGAVLRPARRPHGVVRRHAGADGALLPRPLPVAAPRRGAPPSARPYDGPVRFAFCAQEERQALRLFLRALRRLPDEPRVGGDRLLAHRRRARPARCAAACATG